MAYAFKVKAFLDLQAYSILESMAMNDFINEINQEMREERWRQLWSKYGIYLIAAVIAVVLFVAGRQGLVAYQENARNNAANSYLAALEKDGTDGLDALAQAGGEGYPMLARFQQASRLAASGDAGAEAAYLDLARDQQLDRTYRDAALLLSVMNASPETSMADRENRLSGLASSDSEWRLLARELMIALALERGDRGAAVEAARQLRDITGLPADLEQRLRMIEVALGITE